MKRNVGNLWICDFQSTTLVLVTGLVFGMEIVNGLFNPMVTWLYGGFRWGDVWLVLD